MKQFIRAQLSSLLSTGVDFLLMIVLVECFTVHYTLAVVAGAAGGAITNFIINRYWSFNVTERPASQQVIKYMLVWIGNVLLNVSGVYVLTNFLKIKYILSKMIVAATVGLSFNYLLQKRFVFSTK